jgi:hypothetical protein
LVKSRAVGQAKGKDKNLKWKHKIEVGKTRFEVEKQI